MLTRPARPSAHLAPRRAPQPRGAVRVRAAPRRLHAARASAVVGIDLGTTNSAVAVVERGRAVIVPDAEGHRTTPSVVAYLPSGEVLVGHQALMHALVDPENTFSSVKRFIGRKFADVSEDAARVQFKVSPTADGGVGLFCPALRRSLSPEEVSAAVLRRMLAIAAAHTGQPAQRAIITVPAYFNDAQRRATEAAGLAAGLQRVKLLREPVAAALAYGVDRAGDATVLVVDLGGGTYDVSLLDVGGGTVEVLATSGDAHLGGDDFDAAVARWLAEQPGAAAPPRAMQAAARALREALTARDAVAARLPGAPAPVRLTRAQMESLAAPLLSRLRRPLEQAAWAAGIDLEAARAGAAEAELRAEQSAAAAPGRSKGGGKRGRRAAERAAAEARAQTRVSSRQRPSAAFALNRVISEVLLVGGATRMPAVQRVVAAMTARPVALGAVDPDEAVALGAALQAGALEGSVTDVETMEVWQAALMRALARKVAQDAGHAAAPEGDDDEDEPGYERRRRSAPPAQGRRLTPSQEAKADELARAMQGGAEPRASSPGSRGRVRIVSASADGGGEWDEGELEGMDLDAIAALGLGDVVLDDGVTEVADQDALRAQVGDAAFATLTAAEGAAAAEPAPRKQPRTTKKPKRVATSQAADDA